MAELNGSNDSGEEKTQQPPPPGKEKEDELVVSPNFPGPSLLSNLVLTFSPHFFRSLASQSPDRAGQGEEEKLDFFPLVHKKKYSLCSLSPGAPMAVYALERARVLGAERVVVFGCCGSLVEDLSIGEVLLVEGALSEEGTSPLYPDFNPAPKSDPVLLNALRGFFSSRGVPFFEGMLWTTDAPFRETKRKVVEMRDRGCIGVDMEMAALLNVSRHLGLCTSGVLIISDELGSLSHKSGFQYENFKNSIEQIASQIDTFYKQLKTPDSQSTNEEGLNG